MPSKETGNLEPDLGRLITINLSFQELALLTACFSFSRYPFFEKTKLGNKLSDEQDQIRIALTSLDATVQDQVKNSTYEMSQERLMKNLDNFKRLISVYQNVIFGISEENMEYRVQKWINKHK